MNSLPASQWWTVLFWILNYGLSSWLSSLIIKSICPVELTQLISAGDSQIQVSMPSSSLVIYWPPWHSHWITHCYLRLHLPRALPAPHSLVISLKVAPLSYSHHEPISIQGSKHPHGPCLSHVQTLALCCPQSKCFPVAPFSPFSLWSPKAKLSSF